MIHTPKHIDDDIKWTTEGEVTSHRVSNEEVNIATRTERAWPFWIGLPGRWLMIMFQLRPKCTVWRGVVNTLMHRVESKVNDERDGVEEKSHLKQALNNNGYPDWLIN